MSWYYKPYVSVAQRLANGQKQLQKMRKAGRVIEPLGELSHRSKIAISFWGRAWCEHLESLGDFANRLPRGRTYVRNGSVLHLSIETGKITALVQGSELYEQTIRIDPLSSEKWERIKKRCRGGIGSLIELLQGKVSNDIMGIVTDPADGFFPKPKEIHLDCSCPDWASLCKHLAAILYGVGAKLDQEPELLFKLRGVDHRELIDEDVVTTAITGNSQSGRRRSLDSATLGGVFGIDLDNTADSAGEEPVPENPKAKRPSKSPEAKASTKIHPRTKSNPRTETRSKTRKPFQATPAGVKKLRAALGLSRAEFAEWVGVSTQSVVNWEAHRGSLKLRSANLEKLESLHRSLSSE